MILKCCLWFRQQSKAVPGFYTKQFSEDEIELFKAKREDKDKIFGYNNWDKEYATRWIGDPCEMVFKEFLERHKIPFQHWTTDDKLDDRDFTVGPVGNEIFEVDVKGVSAKSIPREDYACNVVQKQWNRIMKPGNIVNTLVFARFVLQTNMAVIVGAISKTDLREKAEYFPAGTERGVITLSTNNYEISISRLQSIEEYFGRW